MKIHAAHVTFPGKETESPWNCIGWVSRAHTSRCAVNFRHNVSRTPPRRLESRSSLQRATALVLSAILKSSPLPPRLCTISSQADLNQPKLSTRNIFVLLSSNDILHILYYFRYMYNVRPEMFNRLSSVLEETTKKLNSRFVNQWTKDNSCIRRCDDEQ